MVLACLLSSTCRNPFERSGTLHIGATKLLRKTTPCTRVGALYLRNGTFDPSFQLLGIPKCAIPQRSRHYCAALPLPPRGRISARWLFTTARHGIKAPWLWLANKVHDRAAVRVQVTILHIETARQARVRVEGRVKYALVGEFTLARLDHLGRRVPRPVVLPTRSERVRRVVRKEPLGRERIIARRANVGPFIGWTWNVPIPRG